jgi:hypothetical protein
MLAAHNNKGFTLLEAIIYVGLLGILLTGLFVSINPFLDGAARITARVAAEGEAAFILRKIDWALTTKITDDGDSITSPSAGGATTSILSIDPDPGGEVRFEQSGDYLMYVDSTGSTELNPERVPITDFSVTHVATGEAELPRYVEVYFKADGIEVGPARYYLRF